MYRRSQHEETAYYESTILPNGMRHWCSRQAASHINKHKYNKCTTINSPSLIVAAPRKNNSAWHRTTYSTNLPGGSLAGRWQGGPCHRQARFCNVATSPKAPPSDGRSSDASSASYGNIPEAIIVWQNAPRTAGIVKVRLHGPLLVGTRRSKACPVIPPLRPTQHACSVQRLRDRHSWVPNVMPSHADAQPLGRM
jgi:hypothetical protein